MNQANDDDIELTPDENDRFWSWLNTAYGHDGNEWRLSPMEQINRLLKSLPDEPLPGRNDPCFCGSGLKFKRRHGK